MNNITRRAFNKILPAVSVTAILAPEGTAASEQVQVHDDPAEELLALVERINSILQKTAPDGAFVKGFQYLCLNGEIDTCSIWASAMTDDYKLVHLYPALGNGWRPHLPLL